MNRVKSASWGCAVVVCGWLLALPAAAAPKEQTQEQCKGECFTKANAALDSCAQSCPREKDKEAAAKCMSTCGEKFRTAMAACDKSCPAPKPPPQKK